ncbi:hypothetical protein FGO68_gene4865 [Halteria grandinella]|uniref:Uncharacterized protein n=1 Tax=Halteria grandinella TaxID=5974 RepID=A0A8J8NMU2_HALGN|nr:hypothetical protein FGO68_gene4865 [Halteria grandinella]
MAERQNRYGMRNSQRNRNNITRQSKPTTPPVMVTIQGKQYQRNHLIIGALAAVLILIYLIHLLKELTS